MLLLIPIPKYERMKFRATNRNKLSTCNNAILPGYLSRQTFRTMHGIDFYRTAVLS